MYYIVYDEKTKIVHGNPSLKPFVVFTEGLKQIKTTTIPEKYDYLIVSNIKDDTCDLVAKFYVFTKEQIEKQKQFNYDCLVEKYIREKYSLSNELAILRQASAKPEEFKTYNDYAENCKVRAKQEIYK